MRHSDRKSFFAKNLIKASLIASVLILAGAGCVSPKQAAVAPAAETKPVAPPAPPPAPKIEPIKLVYTLKNFFGPKTESDATFWLEEQRKCDGRDAYLGLMNMKMPFGPDQSKAVYAKITVYADTGEMSITKFVSEDELAFDDLAAKYNDLNIPLIVNSFFAYAGKNFNEEAYWNASAPIVLKKVDTGKNISDYSIVHQEEDASGVVPCRKFKIFEKGANMNATYVGCLSKDIGKYNLPFVVSLGFGGDGNMPGWKLKSFASEKSGVAWTPQCLSVVKCVAPKELSDNERRACGSKGGQVEPINDDAGCTTEYKCLSDEDKAERSISNVQPPGCGINPGVKDKLVQCRKRNQPNFDPKQYDSNGCLTDIVCR